ncbi:MAG: hypothetical protein HQ517_11660 [SAR324 cluster bacterium]|nr:hypothetical protein [SAR324 cluster bacterium]
MTTSSETTAIDANINLFNRLTMLPIILGISGAAVLQGVYFTVLSLLNSPNYAWQQFIHLAPWMIPLVGGFGIQVGIFFYMRAFAKLAKLGITNSAPVATSAGISSGSMIACCLHHAVDVLPILGISAVAVFLAEYQSFLLSVGIVSNLIGLSFIFYTIKKHSLFLSGGMMSKIVSFNMKAVFYFTIITGLLALTFIFFNQG